MILKKKRELKWCPDQSWVQIKERKRVRCPTCNRRLLVREQYCVGGEFVGFKIPPHKTRRNI